MILRPLQHGPVGRQRLPQCLPQKHEPSLLLRRRAFHASPRARDGVPDHYATLDVPTNASAADVKKQFFALSKTHHPDRNPDDPQASSRFVKISEAYAVLGSAEKRARYDRDHFRSQPAAAHPGGSYSSSGPAGSRPPTGLSRRRTQFKGPPPSFYRNGGWGAFGQKRAEYASKESHAHEAARAQQDPPPGTGPSGFTSGLNNDVPHFDRDGHFRTHDAVQKNRHKARQSQGANLGDQIVAAPSMLFNFVLLSGVLTIVYGVSGVLFRTPEKRKR